MPNPNASSSSSCRLPLFKDIRITPSSSPSSADLEHGSLSVSTSLLTPVSPEYDSLTELPSPVVHEQGFNTQGNAPSIDLISRFPSLRVPQSHFDRSTSSSTSSISPISPSKKSYGDLATRPTQVISNHNGHNRIVSEFDSGIVKHHNNNTALRNFSSPLNKDIISPQGLEREEQKLSENQPSGPVTYEGYDTQNVLHHWRYVRDIGKGNFSVVVLGESTDPIPNPVLTRVAIKIVLLPAHQETRSRIESSLRRELSILKTVNHPSIIKLLSLNVTRQKYLIMTPYYEGGDLFEISSKHRSKMSPLLIRKMFAEIATGIAYLHSKNIVHRDIKLENILINHTINEMLSIKDFTSTSLITITDFGLSREIDPEDPLLTTRCGSEDYVPPELLIGLPYDGRQTDSWALGVLLYSIMESRLPFDPPPVSPNTIRSRKPPKVAHRIARIDWNWYDFKDENMGKTWLEEDWKDAKYIVENLLIRREKRLTSKEVCELEYVSGMLGQEYRA